MSHKIVTCTAPVNIAVIKYWGKRDEDLILPINDSLSATLSSDQMHSKTTVAISADFESDRLWLNGVEESVDLNPRLVNCLREVRNRASSNKDWKAHICSENNFPTAAGLASSAAGYACLVYSLCQVYDVVGDISELARQGSGSACRSVFGGFVRWHSGVRSDGSDSIATVIKEASHWEDLRILILVANDARKKVGSTKGMQTSVKTSQLLKFRAEQIVPKRIEEMVKAVEEKDFSRFADLTMQEPKHKNSFSLNLVMDSNQLHAVCLDTFPPCVYMNEVSHAVSSLIHQINALKGTNVASYTFDAGPNACIFLPAANVGLVAGLVRHFFPPKLDDDANNFFRGAEIEIETPEQSLVDQIVLEQREGGLKYVLATKVGQGPKVLSDQPDNPVHLIGSNGLPINLKSD